MQDNGRQRPSSQAIPTTRTLSMPSFSTGTRSVIRATPHPEFPNSHRRWTLHVEHLRNFTSGLPSPFSTGRGTTFRRAKHWSAYHNCVSSQSPLEIAASLGALHVAVARAEGLRGHCTDAYRHLDIARRVSRSSSVSVPTPWLDTIESSLELVAGNLVRARVVGRVRVPGARSTNSVKFTVTSGTNIALVALWTGNTQLARSLLQRVFSLSVEFINVRIGALDNSAQLALFENHLDHCRSEIQQCEAIIGSLVAPGPIMV